MTVAEVRQCLVPPLKNYVDITKAFGLRDLVNTIEGWERSHVPGTQCFKKIYNGQAQPNSVRTNNTVTRNLTREL